MPSWKSEMTLRKPTGNSRLSKSTSGSLGGGPYALFPPKRAIDQPEDKNHQLDLKHPDQQELTAIPDFGERVELNYILDKMGEGIYERYKARDKQGKRQRPAQ